MTDETASDPDDLGNQNRLVLVRMPKMLPSKRKLQT
jgi:hypothetical protein